MRICLISGEFPPMQGGVGDYTHEMARAYSDLGHQVVVITLQPPQLADGGSSLKHSEPYDLRQIVARWNWSSWTDVLSVLRETKPDIVNIQYQAAAYGMLPPIHLLPWRVRWLKERPKIVVTYHDLRVPYLFPKAGPLRWQAVLALARWSDAVIVTNPEDEIVLSRYHFIRRLARIPIGSNIAPVPPIGYNRMTWRAHLGVGPEESLLAYFGFLNESKGGETLIHALQKLGSGCKLLMIGGKTGASDPTNAAYAKHMESLIAELGLAERILWTGYVPQEDVSAHLLAADMAVLPYRDGVSLRRGSLMAALAHGLPVVSTIPAACADEFLDGQNILLVPPENPEALAAAVTRVAKSPTLGARLAEGARELSERFAWPEIAKKTVELYHDIL
jgi:glycosyltransferase involved in cell wall biosynthesis